jgi:tetratricopeptide (TPR) repeat protein
MVRPGIVEAAVRGWEANLGGRPPVEQALTRAVLVGHQLLDLAVEPPDAGLLEEAFDDLVQVQPGLFATWESSRGKWLRPSAAPHEVVLDALWRYLLQAMGTHDPQNLALTTVLKGLALHVTLGGILDRARWAVAWLIDAAYQAESGYLQLADDSLAQAVTILEPLGPQFPAILPTVLAVCRETRQHVRDQIPEQARVRRWHESQENAAKEHASRAEDLSVRGKHKRAREQIDRALEIQRQIAAAEPGHPATLELDAYVHGLRAGILLRSGQASAALPDAARSLGGYQRLTTMDPEDFAETLDIAHQVWVNAMTAAATAAAVPPPEPPGSAPRRPGR